MHTLKLKSTLWVLLVLLSLVAAGPSQREQGLGGYDPLVARQDEENTTSEPTQTSEATTTDSEETAETGTATAEPSKTTKSQGPTSVDPRKPAGGIEMVSPGVYDPQTYIKIGEYATFAWNYTSLVVTPTAIDVVAYCSKNDHTYTIAANQSVQETGSAVWNTEEFTTGEAPLLTEIYTLKVYDVELGPDEVASAGHLGSLIQPTFGMYNPKKPTPLSEFTCATCSAAISSLERQALLFMFGMVTVTICSFTWFASGFGLFV